MPLPSDSTFESSTPAVPVELAETIAVFALRLQAVATLWQDPLAIAQPLNVLPRSISAKLTKAALVQLPHVDLDFASIQLGNVDLLDFMYSWLFNASDPKARPLHTRSHQNNPADYGLYPSVIDLASAKGHVSVLAWWFAHSPGLFYTWTEKAIDEASANGHLQTLHWWFHESGLPHAQLKHSAAAMDQASSKGLDHVLDWWLNSSGLSREQLKYSDQAMALAAAHGHWTTLEWWMQSGLTPYTGHVVHYAASKDRLDVLEWCLTQHKIMAQTRTRGLCYDGVPDLVTGAVQRGNHALLSWFAEHAELHEQWHTGAMEEASAAAALRGDWIAILWLKTHGWLHGSINL